MVYCSFSTTVHFISGYLHADEGDESDNSEGGAYDMSVTIFKMYIIFPRTRVNIFPLKDEKSTKKKKERKGVNINAKSNVNKTYLSNYVHLLHWDNDVYHHTLQQKNSMWRCYYKDTSFLHNLLREKEIMTINNIEICEITFNF